jgi:hypothetical protein
MKKSPFDPNDEKQKLAIAKAAWQLEDAIKEKVCDAYPDTLEARTRFFDIVVAQKWHGRALMIMILITIWECPTWCDTSHTWLWGDPQERCMVVTPKGEKVKVMLSGINYLPPGISLICEVAMLLVLLYKLHLEYIMQVRYFVPLDEKKKAEEREEELKHAGSEHGGSPHDGHKKHGKEEHEEEKREAGEYFPLWKIYFCFGMIVLNLADCFVFATFRPGFRLAFLSRTALLCMLPSVIKLYKCISKILIEVGTVAVFFVGFLFFFAWVSVMIFNGMDDPPEDFATFGKAFYGLFVAGVCDEFTDVLLESYTRFRGIGILWFVFLLVVHLLFLSLVLDTLCAGYMKSKEDEVESVREDKATGILSAFKLLNEATSDNPHKLHKEVFMVFVKEYCKSPGVNNKADLYAQVYFDTEKRDYIDELEFCDILALTQYNMWTTRKDSKLADMYPGMWETAIVKDVRKPEGSFEQLMMIVLSINFVLVIIETAYDLNKWDEPWWTEWLEFVFSFIYLGECMIKIGVTGWDFYTSTPSNKFDFMTTMLLLSTSIFESLLGSLSTYANILRLFRLLRIVKQLKSMEGVQFMADTVIKLVCKAQDMLVLLLVVIFGFTVFSVQLFGGLLYEENEKLEGTSYHEEKEFVLNFNDFMMAFGLWFVNLLCEYKPSFAEAVDKTSLIPRAWLLFGLFWAIAVCITFELVKAFTIEVYMDLREKWEAKAKLKAKSKAGKVDRFAFLKKTSEESVKKEEVEEEVKEEESEENSKAPEVMKPISKAFKAQKPSMVFWYTCVNVDEDEWEEVTDSIKEILEEQDKHGAHHGAAHEEKEKHGH